jgi:hypothetical protein
MALVLYLENNNTYLLNLTIALALIAVVVKNHKYKNKS